MATATSGTSGLLTNAHELARGVVERAVADVCQQKFGKQLRALILTGSLARAEFSLRADASRVEFLSDAELIGILEDSALLPSGPEARRLATAAEKRLEAKKLYCHISLGFAHQKFLWNMAPHIFGYELKACGKVLVGDQQILSSVPPFAPEDIPPLDGWQMLSNRLVELIEAVSKCQESAPSEEVAYRTMKLYLDMGTSLLLFLGGFTASYVERSRYLRDISTERRVESLPFDLVEFARTVETYTAKKLSCPSSDIQESWQSVRAACERAFQLWIWELQQMTRSGDSSPTKLCLRLAKLQPLAQRVRGWCSVARHQGWARSCRNWPRWARLFVRSSPRYWVYAATGEILLQRDLLLTRTLDENGGSPPLAGLWKMLPCLPGSFESPNSATALLSALAWNYHEFLEGTRG